MKSTRILGTYNEHPTGTDAYGHGLFKYLFFGESLVPKDLRPDLGKILYKPSAGLLGEKHYGRIRAVFGVDLQEAERIGTELVLCDLRRAPDETIHALIHWRAFLGEDGEYDTINFGHIPITPEEMNGIFEEIRGFQRAARHKELLPGAFKKEGLDHESILAARERVLSALELDDAHVKARRDAVSQKLLDSIATQKL